MAGGQEKWIQSVGETSCDKCFKSSVIYSRKSALADNISSLSSGGGGGGASNPALGTGEMGIQYLFHDSDRSSGALKSSQKLSNFHYLQREKLISLTRDSASKNPPIEPSWSKL